MTATISDLIFYSGLITFFSENDSGTKKKAMKKTIFILLTWYLTVFTVSAQVEQVIVETYYVSDGKDASDEDGGYLEEGSVTYRIYLDLVEGNKLISIYGNENHALKFASTEKFFNNLYRDKTFGYQINKNNLDNNTLALDSWLTIGFASNLNFGLPKPEDPDGSIVGGINNDGGSAGVPGGLLTNNDPNAGIPLTESDGLVPSTISTTGFFDLNIISENGDDSTIFGALTNAKTFTSYNARLLYSQGISGPTADNRILVAQLTTKGMLSFELNLEIQKSDGTTINYVAAESAMGVDTFYSRWLSYPFSCGCTDPDFLEYDKNASCDDGSCATPLILGCTDPAACNFDPAANKNIPEMCCFNSQCALELGIVCPETVYGCMDPASLNYNPNANASSEIDTCCYTGGCMDSRYLEYNPDACFDDGSYCKVLKIWGCMDMVACNYNPFANISSPEDCIFGCNEKATGLYYSGPEETENIEFEVYPNPFSGLVTVKINVNQTAEVYYSVVDVFGKSVVKAAPVFINGLYRETIDLTAVPAGIYIIEVYIGGIPSIRKIIKNPK
jgi:hypothetical protein